MTQAEFSKLAETFIKQHHPALAANIEYKDDGSLECSVKTPSGKLSLWVANFNIEITIGFDDTAENSYWNSTMTSLGYKEHAAQLTGLGNLLADIFSGKKQILNSSIEGYYLAGDIAAELKQKAKGEKLTVHNWADL